MNYCQIGEWDEREVESRQRCILAMTTTPSVSNSNFISPELYKERGEKRKGTSLGNFGGQKDVRRAEARAKPIEDGSGIVILEWPFEAVGIERLQSSGWVLLQIRGRSGYSLAIFIAKLIGLSLREERVRAAFGAG
nr:hypothetical protein Iba_chr08dCG9880 [Ipomoea batatas]